MSRIHFIGGEKGGIGKSVLSRVLCQYFLDNELVFEGFDAQPTPEGISTATTRTVVYSSLAVLAMDFLLTAIMFGVH